MSNAPPKLTDRQALLNNRTRMQRTAWFLHDEARDELQDRLAMVNKSFTTPAIVTGHPKIWADFLPNAHVVSDDDTLDLQPESHDLVIHVMGLHWANDPVGQLIQCRRALKPDGLFLCILLGGQTLNELRSCLSQAEVSVRGGLSPRVAPMADVRDLGALLQRGGFALPVADSATLTAEYSDLPALMRDLRTMGEANALAGRDRHMTRRAVFDQAAQTYAEAFPGQQKPLRATYELITLTGWAPHASQQKPLRPGSAKTRLSDALGADETSLLD